MAQQPREFVTLSQPVQAHGETVQTLQMRSPTAGDLAKAGGKPFSIRNMAALGDGVVEPDIDWHFERALNLLAALCSVPRSTIDSLPWGDIEFLLNKLFGLFSESLRATGEAQPEQTTTDAPSSIPPSGSEPASTLPGSGSVIPSPSLRSVGRS